jgi:hypothetical protein
MHELVVLTVMGSNWTHVIKAFMSTSTYGFYMSMLSDLSN